GLVLQAIDALPLPETWPVPVAAAFLERRLGDLFPALGIRAVMADGSQSAAAPGAAVIGLALGDERPVWRRPDGTPEAAEPVSASHCGPLTLAVAAAGPVGCDIEAVAHHPEPVWRDP